VGYYVTYNVTDSKDESSSSNNNFTCDGREYCSQMTSCEEAKYFIKNCPNTKMDGDHNGIPCEKQWCQNESDSSDEYLVQENYVTYNVADSKYESSSSNNNFTCDGREYCSQMTSCEEAKYFIKYCPNTKMDGDHDGIPCERQWCH
jgi:hypothetical protein